MAFLRLLMSDHFNIFSFNECINSEEAAIQAAYDLNLIPKIVDCPLCGFRMLKERKASYKLGFRWICHRRICRKYRISPLKNTFFEATHLPFRTTFKLIVCWFFRLQVSLAAIMCDVSRNTAVDFYNFCREVCRVVDTHDQVQIGGPGDVVEVDESHLFTPKFHRGRPMRRRGILLLGGVSRLTNKRFAVRIASRDRNTIWPLMQLHIAQGSFIMTDQAPVYQGCDVLGFSGHCATNHSLYYVRPIQAFVPDGHHTLGQVIPNLGVTRVPAHSNKQERTWEDIKNNYIRRCRRTEMLDNYVSEYLYRKNTLDEVPNIRRCQGLRFFKYMDDLRRVYPGPQIPRLRITGRCRCEECA